MQRGEGIFYGYNLEDIFGFTLSRKQHQNCWHINQKPTSFKKKRPKIDQNIPNFWFKIGLLCLNPDALLLHRLQKCSSQIVIVKEHMHICTKMHNSSFAYIYSVRFITYLKEKNLSLLRGRQDFGRSAKSVECRKNMTR